MHEILHRLTCPHCWSIALTIVPAAIVCVKASVIQKIGGMNARHWMAVSIVRRIAGR